MKMNKQELFERISHLPSDCSGPLPMINKLAVLEFIKLLDEPQKVTIPQFVADYIKDAKYYEWDLDDVFDHIAEESEESEIYKWFYTLGNIDVFARAWLDGYEVEKEKRYRVKMKNAYYNKHPQFLCETDNGIFWAAEIDLRKTKFTKKELEEAGFGEVFNSPLFEVEEVEE